MNRRHFLASTAALALLPARLTAQEATPYTPGLAEAAMDAGKVVVLDFYATWCSTCAAQQRTLAALKASNPAYAEKITFITVDWDQYGEGDLSKALRIPRRSTLVALQGRRELARLVAGTGKAEVKELLDLALAAGSA